MDDRKERDEMRSNRQRKVDEFKSNFDKSVLESEFDSDLSPSESSSRRKRRGVNITSFSNEDTKARIEKESRKALKQQKKEDKKIEKSKAKRNKRIFRLVWIVMIAFIAIVLSQVILVGVNDMLAITRENEEGVAAIEIPENPTLDQIADILYTNGVIKEPYYFKLYANFTSSVDGFRRGKFEIEKDKDYEAIINFLQSNNNRKDTKKLQITEGMNVLEISKLLYDEGVSQSEQEFLDMCNSDYFDEDFDFLQNIKNKDERYYKLEGYLFPDTYEFYLGEEPEMTISRLLNNYDNKINYDKAKYFGDSKKSTLKDEMEKSDYSMDEIITIASIIQAEAATEEDMYYISSIIHNRLERGQDASVNNLGLDSTVFYPYRTKKDVPESIRDTYDSSYDTNKFAGLPPGPICNPSLEAIKAALDPADTDYFFFCHDTVENGSTPYYAETYDGHQYNLSLIGQ